LFASLVDWIAGAAVTPSATVIAHAVFAVIGLEPTVKTSDACEVPELEGTTAKRLSPQSEVVVMSDVNVKVGSRTETVSPMESATLVWNEYVTEVAVLMNGSEKLRELVEKYVFAVIALEAVIAADAMFVALARVTEAFTVLAFAARALDAAVTPVATLTVQAEFFARVAVAAVSTSLAVEPPEPVLVAVKVVVPQPEVVGVLKVLNA
jgi:hypothetical protein